MNAKDFIKKGKAALVFDGDLGELYASKYNEEEMGYSQASFDAPERIRDLHRQYIFAGARAIRTNTYDASKMICEYKEDQAMALIEASWNIATETAAPYGTFVFATLGPTPADSLEPAGQVFIRQIDKFLELGADHFMIETLSNDEGIAEVSTYLKAKKPEAFLIVSFAASADGITRDGHTIYMLSRRVARMGGVDAVGMNRITGPTHMLHIVEEMENSEKLLCVMPNAGYPTIVGGKTVFESSPEYFAEKVIEMINSGASIVGGGRGSSPMHIAHLSEMASKVKLRKRRSQKTKSHGKKAYKNPLQAKLATGQKPILVELDPPEDDVIDKFFEGAKALKAAGIDAMTIADCPVGRPRADSSLLACKIKREIGLEVIPHMTCRDRNLNATKALLMGLSMEGIHNVLLVTGDPVPTEDRNEVKSVFNFNSRKLIRYVSGLNESLLSAPFQIFAALNVNARNFDAQLEIAREKEENGAQGFLTQPILSPEGLENLKIARAELKGKIFGGIFPVVSYRNACFLNNEVAGISVSEDIMRRYEGKDREECEDIAVEISAKIAKDIEPYIDGYYFMTPFNRVSLIKRILDEIR